ncbi:mucin-13 [Sceloporus undulatus]|uniref:mucin-13 n=1 Tax=Sceloporus undulatus TaxID=8520 RepID=UPI001C4C86B5|nr:mucin-13 [Sceloporus undulatus]
MKGCVVLTIIWLTFSSVKRTSSTSLPPVTASDSAFTPSEDTSEGTTSYPGGTLPSPQGTLDSSPSLPNGGPSSSSLPPVKTSGSPSPETTTSGGTSLTPEGTLDSSPSPPEGGPTSSPLPPEETSGSPSLEATTPAPEKTSERATSSYPGGTSLTPTSSPLPPGETSRSPSPETTTSEHVTCNSQSCKYGAICVSLNQNFFCKCPYGYYYSLQGCQLGKVFPGEIGLQKQYDPSMKDVQSPQYAEVYHNVTNFFNERFKDEETYKETLLLDIIPSPATLEKLSKAEGTIAVTIINMFEASTNLTSVAVAELITNKTCGGVIICNSFKAVPQCDVYGCDKDTTDCSEPTHNSFPTCYCKTGLDKKKPDDKTCLLCNATVCSPKENKYCSVNAKQVPVCQCLVGYQNQDGYCQKCSFGYSGEDCKDNYLAVLVGVAVACGFVIVVLIGVLIYRCLRENREPKPESKSLLSHDYSTIGNTSESGSAPNTVINERIFPRVQIRSPEQVNKTNTADRGHQEKISHDAGVLNKSYLPERDYDDDNNPWLEMSSRDRM